jgi:hypothetical protein
MRGTPEADVVVGAHRCEWLPPDRFVLTVVGTPTEADMAQLFDFMNAKDWKDPTFMVVDFRKLESLPANARRVVAERSKARPMSGVVIVGAKFPQRVIATLIHGAMKMLTNKAIPEEFVDDLESAWRIIDKWREGRSA